MGQGVIRPFGKKKKKKKERRTKAKFETRSPHKLEGSTFHMFGVVYGVQYVYICPLLTGSSASIAAREEEEVHLFMTSLVFSISCNRRFIGQREVCKYRGSL